MIEYFVTYCMYQEQKNDWEKDNICSYANLINERTDKCKDFVWLLRRETPLREINLQIELLGKKKILDVIRIVGMYIISGIGITLEKKFYRFIWLTCKL